MNIKSLILIAAFTLAVTAESEPEKTMETTDAMMEETMVEEVKGKPLAKKPSACRWEKKEHKKGKRCWDDYADCDYDGYAHCPYDDDRCEDKKVVIPDCPEKKCPSWDINWKGCSTCA